jgi:hypothetical protein
MQSLFQGSVNEALRRGKGGATGRAGFAIHCSVDEAGNYKLHYCSTTSDCEV